MEEYFFESFDSCSCLYLSVPLGVEKRDMCTAEEEEREGRVTNPTRPDHI